MPGGGSSKELSDPVDYNICSLPASYLKNGRINNTLLSQSIALGLNIGITKPSTLGSFVLQAGVLATAAPVGGCGSNVPKIRVCNYNPLAPYNLVSVTNEYRYRTITATVVNAIVGPKTVQGLLNLANSALANADGIIGSENGASLSDIAGAAGAINEVFDECQIFVGWNIATCAPTQVSLFTSSIALPKQTEEVTVVAMNVSVFPNPFTDQVKFQISSPVSAKGTIEIYSMIGQKLETINLGQLFAGKGRVVEYKVAPANRTNLIYVLTIGNERVVGKLINLR